MKPRVVPLALARPSSLVRAVSNWRRLARRVRSSVTASSSTSWRSQALRRAREACAASCSTVAITLRSTRLLRGASEDADEHAGGQPVGEEREHGDAGRLGEPAAPAPDPARGRARARAASAGASTPRRPRSRVRSRRGRRARTTALPVTARIVSVPARWEITMQLGRPAMCVARWASTSARSPVWRGVVERDGEVVEGLDVRSPPPQLALVDGAEGRGAGADEQHGDAEGQRALGSRRTPRRASAGGRRAGSGARPPP